MDIRLLCPLLFSLILYGSGEEIECSADSDSENIDTQYFSEDLPLVVLDYNKLLNHTDLTHAIETAYGPSGLGILLVKNVPDLELKRLRVLQSARDVAYLDEDVLKSLEDEESLYSIGYSKGKEMLAKDQPDYKKMSYYGNPITDDPTNSTIDLITNYRSVYGKNIWPDNELPSLKEYFMDMGTLINSVGILIAHQLDQYTMRVRDGYEAGLFQEIIGTNIPKARLLYYFSENELEETDSNNNINNNNNNNNNRSDNWCGWHNDHSVLTGLVLGGFFNGNGDVIDDIRSYGKEEHNLQRGGLHIQTRTGEIHQIELSEKESSKYLAFQIGETSQILSGGALVATPHAVMGYQGNEFNDISRASYVVFHQPHITQSMTAPYHDGVTLENIQFDRFLPKSVPPLSSRWYNDSTDTYGEYSRRTFETYYNQKMNN